MNTLLIVLGLVAASPLWAQSAVTPRYSILQGSTGSSTTHFTVVADIDEQLSFAARDSAGRQLTPSTVERATQPGSRWVVYRMRFDDLVPHEAYHLQVFDDLQSLVDERGFQTLDTKATHGQVAFGSCMVRQLHNPFMWDAIAAQNPDLILLLGDEVYLDRDYLLVASDPTSILQVWESFAASRNTLKVYFWPELKPIVTIWDDHDSGTNDDDGKFPLIHEVREVFDTYFANEEVPGFLQHGPALAKQFELYGKNWILLDGRTYRDLDMSSPLFGKAQEQWLLDQIKPGQNIIMSGSQFYGKFIQKDSMEFNWPDYATQFTARLKAVGNERNASYIFGSGDIHFSEVERLEPGLFGYETFEITSSSIHSFAFPGHYILKPENPRRIAVTGTHNAVFLDLHADSPEIGVRSVGWRGGDLFNITIRPGRPSCAELLTATAPQERVLQSL